jgi:flavin reductase (DIM6/NTAB) family NADH-FMN oxidoreductase RutF
MWNEYVPDELDARRRYQLLTSLVVPRPIGWLGTRSRERGDNLAPFSYFAAVSASPMLVSVSIGHRIDRPKDSLANVRETGVFTVNVVDVAHLDAMNTTSARAPHGVDEFELAGLEKAQASAVDAPYVADAPAVFECGLEREVDLGEAPNTLVLGRVRAVRVRASLARLPGTEFVDTEALRPVGRLWGPAYMLPGEIVTRERPD